MAHDSKSIISTEFKSALCFELVCIMFEYVPNIERFPDYFIDERFKLLLAKVPVIVRTILLQ